MRRQRGSNLSFCYQWIGCLYQNLTGLRDPSGFWSQDLARRVGLGYEHNGLVLDLRKSPIGLIMEASMLYWISRCQQSRTSLALIASFSTVLTVMVIAQPAPVE